MPIEFKWELNGTPGVQKDTTPFNTQYYLNGIWTRFYNQKPKKIGGCRLLLDGTDQIIRDCFSVNLEASGAIDLYMGASDFLLVSLILSNGTASTPRNRTPVGFVGHPDNTWSFATVTYGDVTYILAVATQNLNNINNEIPGIIYYGDILSDDPLTPILEDGASPAPIQTSGGITTIGSIIFVYDANGLIRWNNGLTVSGNPTIPVPPAETWPIENSQVIGIENFVYGAPIRNGDVFGGLFWGVQGLVKATFIGTNTDTLDDPQPLFDFSYVSTACTLLSTNAVVFYDPYFYWPGTNTFYVYTGVVDELDNQVNKLFFFSNLNRNSKNRVFGFANTQYQEVWWGWANGDAQEENNWALMFNKNYKTWFDSPNFTRSSGIPASTIFPYPILADSALERSITGVSYPLWQHEIGTDIKIGALDLALPASIQFRYIENPDYHTLIADDLILDIEQSGNLLLQVSKQGYPRSTPILSDTVIFPSSLEHLTMREKGNLLSFIFSSNEIGGDFYFGKTIAIIKGDETERPGPVNA